jgi:hypothetical protein
MKEKIGAVAAAVGGVLAYIKVTIVTLSVTNRHTLVTPPYYVGGLTRCVICNYSAGASVACVGGAVGGEVDG